MPIPDYLLNNPFRSVRLRDESMPVAIVDGTVFELKKQQGGIKGSTAFVVGMDQQSFDRFTPLLEVERIHFNGIKVADLSALGSLPIKELAIHANSKLIDLSPLGALKALNRLVIENTPKATNLDFLKSTVDLELFAFGGGIWNKNTADSLEPLRHLKHLKSLHLSNLKVNQGGIRPIAHLRQLTELFLTNQFPTEDYAYLKAKLPDLECEMLAPYVKLRSPIGEKDVMVVGTRKPLLNSVADKVRMERYVQEFQELVNDQGQMAE